MIAKAIRRHGWKTPKWLEKWAKSHDEYRFKRNGEHRSAFYDYGERRPVQLVMERERNG